MLTDTSFDANQAGGVGWAEAVGSPLVESQRNIRAAHILSPGITVAHRCVFTSTSLTSLPYCAPWWIVGIAAGRITFVNSTFQGSSAGQADGMLSFANDVSALLRGCAGKDVMIDPKVGGKLGIVDSTFVPALGSVKSIAPPACGTEVAGQRMCDPRAACTLRPSGGVQCECKGQGIEPPAGAHDDGSRCVTTSSLSVALAAPAVRLIVLKPGKHPDLITLNVAATGGEGFNATYSRRTVLRRDGSAVAQSDDGLHARVFGLAFEWNEPQPTAMVSIPLDAAKQRYSAAIANPFTLSLQCTPSATGGTICPQDGDTIETTINVTPKAGTLQAGSATPTEARITTEIQATLSCEHTKPTVRVVANTDLDSIMQAAPLSLHLLALDVNNAPVGFTRAEMKLSFGGRNVSMQQWRRGSNAYVADVPAELTQQPGRYELVVSASNAWSENGLATSCELMRRTITIKEGLSTTWILVGAGSTSVVVVGGLIIVVRKRHTHLHAIMAMLFTEVRTIQQLQAILAALIHSKLPTSARKLIYNGSTDSLQQVSELVGSISMGVADVITDGIAYARLLSGEIAVSDEYKAAYVSVLCIGLVSTTVAMAYRLHNAYLVRAHLLEMGQQDRKVSSIGRRQAQQHEYELAQLYRTKVILSLSLLTVVSQGASCIS